MLGLHSQATAWQGLHAMGRGLVRTGQGDLARRCAALAERLETGLRRAVASSQRQLEDGSLFLPRGCSTREPAYESRPGGSSAATGTSSCPTRSLGPRFAQAPRRPAASATSSPAHRLLGVVRAGAYALYEQPAYPVSGTDQVYGINAARFLADNDAADQLVLSLYGSLAVAMTPGTFVAGRAASVAPLGGRLYRAMYLPPNGAASGLPRDAPVSPRPRDPRSDGAQSGSSSHSRRRGPGYGRAGGSSCARAPTSFGPVSYSLEARADTILATIDVPVRTPPKSVALQVRLPARQRVAAVTVNGRPIEPAERRRSGTIDLSGHGSHLEVVVRYGSRRPAASAKGVTSVKRLRIHYIAHDGRPNVAHVVLPSWYGPPRTRRCRW